MPQYTIGSIDPPLSRSISPDVEGFYELDRILRDPNACKHCLEFMVDPGDHGRDWEDVNVAYKCVFPRASGTPSRLQRGFPRLVLR